MKRIMLTLVACASVLAVALSTAPAAAADPTGLRMSSRAAAGYEDCPAGYSCYFDGLNGTGAFIYADHGCDYYDLAGSGWDNRISSIYNRGSSKVFVYTGRGTSFDVHGWMPVGQRGNYNTNDIDGILVGC
ncbi:hypothetical protein ACTI_44430 [Actinoplanes sp. OR16]|uniref:peptidase inhibitor family I36 protein n=1 Tax=Actinoplanes sp. OR16 TaxID=946334 RepID=UPI000F6B3720|nr:peptidase inhibitor family I36 protein [Actinoplanes sp. OR16]BBH67758.1 hypothetical protein ACTI_44430 [Actinoplanes sp. OR16]